MSAGNRAAMYERMLRAKREAVAGGLAPCAEGLSAVCEDDQPQVHQHEAVSMRLNSLGYAQLRMIEEALDRLAAGDYGICCACERPIPPRRLEAVPWARYCVPCQQRMDDSASLARDLVYDDGGSIG